MTEAKAISPRELGERLGRDGGFRLIDVRHYDEFAAVRVRGAECVPLPQLLRRASEWDPSDCLAVICQKDPRSREAVGRLVDAGFTDVCFVEGGTLGCVDEGLPAVRGRRILPLQRQVQIIVGTMILAGLAAGLVYPPLVALAWFGSAGLAMAGITGFCPLARLVARAPWNRAAAEPQTACVAGSCG